jgi:hypothetical protein
MTNIDKLAIGLLGIPISRLLTETDRKTKTANGTNAIS